MVILPALNLDFPGASGILRLQSGFAAPVRGLRRETPGHGAAAARSNCPPSPRETALGNGDSSLGVARSGASAKDVPAVEAR